MRFTNCTLLDHETIISNGTVFQKPEEKLSTADTLFWVYLGVYILLMLSAGIFYVDNFYRKKEKNFDETQWAKLPEKQS